MSFISHALDNDGDFAEPLLFISVSHSLAYAFNVMLLPTFTGAAVTDKHIASAKRTDFLSRNRVHVLPVRFEYREPIWARADEDQSHQLAIEIMATNTEREGFRNPLRENGPKFGFVGKVSVRRMKLAGQNTVVIGSDDYEPTIHLHGGDVLR